MRRLLSFGKNVVLVFNGILSSNVIPTNCSRDLDHFLLVTCIDCIAKTTSKKIRVFSILSLSCLIEPFCLKIEGDQAFTNSSA